MSVVVLADSLSGVSPGQRVRAVAGGACVGEATYTGENFAIPVWGSDPVYDNGLHDGTPFSLIVIETGLPLTGMYGTPFGAPPTHLTYAPDAVLLSRRLAVFSSQVGFASTGISVEQGTTAAASVVLQHTGTVALAGFQFDLLAEGVGLDEVVAGPAVSGSGWSFSVAPLEGGVRVVALNTGGGLAEGTHTVLNLALAASDGGTVQIAHAIGTLADDAGTDAELGIGQGLFTVGVAPRGDVNESGSVDIADFVAAIDIVLAVSDFHAAADLYPFPDGDDLVDVRDLNVLGRALLAGAWPDGSPVVTSAPRSAPARSAPQPNARRGAGNAELFLYPVAEGYHLGTDTALRAVQGTAETEGEVTALDGATVVTHADSTLTHFIVYSLSTDPLPAVFATGPGDLGAETLSDLVGVTPQGDTVPLTIVFATGSETGPEEAVALEIFPNPTRGSVRFTRATSGTVYDVLGRRVLDFDDVSRLDLNTLRVGRYFVRTPEGTVPLTVAR